MNSIIASIVVSAVVLCSEHSVPQPPPAPHGPAVSHQVKPAKPAKKAEPEKKPAKKADKKADKKAAKKVDKKFDKKDDKKSDRKEARDAKSGKPGDKNRR